MATGAAAVLLYRDALELDPRLAPAHCNLGEILAGSGPLNEAIDHYRQALQIDPDCARAHHLLGVALLAKGRRDEVDDCYPEGVNPSAPSAVTPGPGRSHITGKLTTLTPSGRRPGTRSAFPRRTRPD